MSDDFDKDKVIARVKKMLAIANNDGATEGERDTAMRQVQTILTKYNLHMSELETEKEVDDRGTSQLEGYGYPWARQAARAVGELFFCKYYVSSVWYTTQRGHTAKKSDRIKHSFIGRESNTLTASSMADYVIKSILREAGARMRRDNESWSWHTSFCQGAADSITSRCWALKQEAEAEHAKAKTPGAAVVLANFYAQERALNDAYGETKLGLVKTKLRGSSNVRNGAGYDDGHDHGKKIGLSRQVGSMRKDTLRLK